jgi:hypothetical protein
LTDAELSCLTFAEFAALVERHRRHERAADQRAALVPWAIAQMNGHDVELEAFLPKTEAEREMERYERMKTQFAWFMAKATSE